MNRGFQLYYYDAGGWPNDCYDEINVCRLSECSYGSPQSLQLGRHSRAKNFSTERRDDYNDFSLVINGGCVVVLKYFYVMNVSFIFTLVLVFIFVCILLAQFIYFFRGRGFIANVVRSF